MTIIELLQSDGFAPKHKCRNEYASPCPACGGRDRLVIHAETDRAWCRQCGWKGDAIQYSRDFRGMSFREAATAVGKVIPLPCKRSSAAADFAKYKPAAPTIDRGKWRQQAKKVVAFARQELERRPERLEWLQTERGITKETAERFNLGWLPHDLYLDRAGWGLPEELKEDGTPKKLFIPSGLVIPGSDRIRIRRHNPGEYGRYHVVPGSLTAPLEIGTPHETVGIVVESELDGILLAQEITRDVFVVAIGSTNLAEEHKANILEKLQNCPVVLVAFDSDQPGAKAAAGWIENNSGSLDVFRAPVPPLFGKDFTEAFLAGLNLNEWLSVCLELYAEQLDRRS